MKIELNKNQVKGILELYYKKYEGVDCKISISSKKELVGYYEHEECVVTINQKSKINILGEVIESCKELSEDNVMEAFKTILEEENLELKSIEYNSGLESVTRGYYMGEHTEYEPYFRGITINVKQLEKGKQKINKINNN